MNKFLNPKNYLTFSVDKIFFLISLLIKVWEDRFINKYSAEEIVHQPVFIIGAPRTGSTILYQSLTNQLDVLYVDNLVCLFKYNIFFGFWLSNILFKGRSHDCFKSEHGDTLRCGFRAPSECGGFWYRWLPKGRHFIGGSEVEDFNYQRIRDEITAVSNYYKKPIVFKNLNAGQRMQLIKRIFPKAKFIFVRRNPYFTAQSILKGKRKLGLSDDEFWGIMPYNVEELRNLNWSKQIAGQVFSLEKQIATDSKLFPEKNTIEVYYSKLNANTVSQFEAVLGVAKRNQFDKPDIKLSEKVTLNGTEEASLKNAINELDWSDTCIK